MGIEDDKGTDIPLLTVTTPTDSEAPDIVEKNTHTDDDDVPHLKRQKKNNLKVDFKVDYEGNIFLDVKDVFCELAELMSKKGAEDKEWIETARWVKFEEDVELDGGKWSKPRVATLQMNQLRTFRDLLAEGAYLQDLDGNTFPEVVDSLVERLSRAVPENISEEKLKDVLLRKHHHQHEKKPSYSLANFKRSLSTTKSEEASASNGFKSFEKKNGLTTSTSFTNGTSPILKDNLSNQMPLENDLRKTRPLRRNYSLINTGDRRLFSRSESTKTDGTDPEDPESFGTDGDDVFKDSDEIYKPNQNFMRKIPKGAEVCNILVGNVDFLPNPLCCFCRLSNASILGDMTEVPLPTRFIFLLLGPARDPESSYHDLGRAMGALMCDEVFQECAYKAHNMQELVDGVDEFIDSTTVLPSSEWNPAIRVEPPQNIPSQAKRKKKMKKTMIGRRRSSVASAIYFKARRFSSLLDEDDEEEEVPGHADPTLIRTGRPFGGLVDDFKRKIRWYLSDFRDAIHYKCLAPFIFLYFALLTSNVTFGGLLTEGTHSHLGNIENILGAAICGATYALFSGQPLTIISSTGPMLIFEKVYYKFCNDRGWDYLESRVWVGLWISIILLVIVAFDLSALVRYITKFTEESFAMLISLIFIFEAFEKTVSISDHYPVHMHTERAQKHECYCLHPNMTDTFNSSDIYTSLHLPFNCTFNPGEDDFGHLPHGPECMNRPIVSMFECTADGGVLHGPGCFEEKFVENVFFFSVLLFLGTFIIAWKLKQFRASNYFPSKVRSVVSDFAVPIALAIMIGADRIVSIDTPKLNVPSKIQPTYENRTSWIVNPLTENNPWWLALAAILPAALATILIFLDQQITAVIVNRKENKLKKGRGYHLDLFVLAVQIGLCSIFGLPWFVAATVESLTHVDSLKEESECTAPGEKPKFLGVREQRVTGFFIFVLIGCSVFLSGFLQYVPMPVLYGVFLYMGVCALKGKELMQRIRIIFMPQKYQPDYMFLRHVKTKRIHIFTLIQVVCLALLWVVKMVKIISIAFPLMVLAMCVVRIVLLDRVFNQRELLWLDDILPGKEVTTEDWEEKGGRSSDSESVDTKEINQNTKLEGDAMV